MKRAAARGAGQPQRRRAGGDTVLREPSPGYGQHIGPVLVDSGPLVALFNGADRWHARVVDWLRRNTAATLVATWPVATEVCTLLAQRIGNDAALDFLRWSQRGGITLDVATAGSLTEVLRIGERFADAPFDLADASIAEAAARLGIGAVLSIDAGTAVYRDRAGRPLRNVLGG